VTVVVVKLRVVNVCSSVLVVDHGTVQVQVALVNEFVLNVSVLVVVLPRVRRVDAVAVVQTLVVVDAQVLVELVVPDVVMLVPEVEVLLIETVLILVPDVDVELIETVEMLVSDVEVELIETVSMVVPDVV